MWRAAHQLIGSVYLTVITSICASALVELVNTAAGYNAWTRVSILVAVGWVWSYVQEWFLGGCGHIVITWQVWLYIAHEVSVVGH